MVGFAATWRIHSDEFRIHDPSHRRPCDLGALSKGDITVVGNWRADNVSSLAGELGLSPDSAAGLVLAEGWRRWKSDLAERLRGNFAIAIHDSKARQVYCARDGLGVEPLFIARYGEVIGIAGSPVDARVAAGLRSSPDETKIASFLRGAEDDKVRSFHRGLSRVAPGHWALLDEAGEKNTRYWDFSRVEVDHCPTDTVGQFRELFDESVRLCGLNGPHLGLMLSGGLDSSAIAGAVNELRESHETVQTFSLSYRNMPGWADGPFIDALRDNLEMIHHSLPSTAHNPLTDMDELLTMMDGPSFGYGASVSGTILPFARASGVNTLLHGHGGDEIVSYGTGRLNELARTGQWRALWRECAGVAALSGKPRWKVFDRYLKHLRGRRWIDRQWQKVHPSRAGAQVTGDEPSFLAGDFEQAFPDPDEESVHVGNCSDHSERDLQLAALDAPLQARALETVALRARYYGLEVNMPFMSRELAEFSLSLPSEWKLRGGYTRYILREAMRGRVPEAIIKRRDKNDFTRDFILGLLSDTERLRDLTNPEGATLKGYVNSDWLRDAWHKVEQLGENISGETARGLWQAAVLAMWLEMDRDIAINRNNKLEV